MLKYKAAFTAKKSTSFSCTFYSPDLSSTPPTVSIPVVVEDFGEYNCSFHKEIENQGPEYCQQWVLSIYFGCRLCRYGP